MLKKLTELHEMARKQSRRRLALAAAHDAHAMGAVINAHQNELVDGIFIGDEEKIRAIAEESHTTFRPLPSSMNPTTPRRQQLP